MPLLAERYRIFAPDSLGSGNFDPLPTNVRIADMARSMIDFMDFLGIEKTHIFGFHTGNKIATEMAAAWPSRVKNLILIRDVEEVYRAIFDFDLGGRMQQIKARTLLIEVATP